MKKILMTLTSFLCISSISAAMPTDHLSFFLEDLHNGFVHGQPLPTPKSIPLEGWQSYSHPISSGSFLYFDFPSVPETSITFDKVWITGRDSFNSTYLVHIEDPMPEIHVSSAEVAAVFSSTLEAGGFNITFTQETTTAQGYSCCDVYATDSEKNYEMKWRFIDLNDGTIIFLGTVSQENQDEHEVFINSIHVEND